MGIFSRPVRHDFLKGTVLSVDHDGDRGMIVGDGKIEFPVGVQIPGNHTHGILLDGDGILPGESPLTVIL